MAILLGIFFLAQIIIKKKKFRLFQLTQLLATIVYGFCVDLTTNMLSGLPDEAVWQRVIYCALGIVSLALGVFTMLKADFTMLPQDAVVKVISKKHDKDYGKIKISLDSILTVIAGIGSWFLYKELVHIGIGTIAAAIFVGKIIEKLKEIERINYLFDRTIGEV